MAGIFTKTLIVNKDEQHKKDVRLIDGDVTVYGIFREDKGKIAQIVKFEEGGGTKTLLAELEWLGDKKDKIRIAGGEWQKVSKAWDHYNFTKDRETYISAFTGADGRRYVWHLRGHLKVLSVGDKGGPVVAKHEDQGTAGALDLTSGANEAGDMLYITFLAAEGYRGRVRFSWFQALQGGGMSGGV